MHWKSLLRKGKNQDFQRHAMKILIFILTLAISSCSGFEVYDYEAPVTEEALNASLARINSQSWGRNLYGVVRSHVTRVDMWDSDAYRLELQFSIRETVCTKASGRDPSTCDFKIGPFVPTAFCRSVVEVSGELISDVIVQCHGGTSSSESMSSEEGTRYKHLLLKADIFLQVVINRHLKFSTAANIPAGEYIFCNVVLVLAMMMRMPIMNPNRRGSSRREDVFSPEAFRSRRRGSSGGDWRKPSYFSSDRIE